MPFRTLDIEDTDRGLPRQPVPLRFAWLVTGLSFACFRELLADRQEYRYEYLTAYEFAQDEAPRVVQRTYYDAHLPKTRDRKVTAEMMQSIPANHFVWSDELAGAFSNYIRDTHGYDEASAYGMGLEWNPALYGLDDLIEECPDLSQPRLDSASPAELSKQTLRKQETAALHERWREAYAALKSEHPNKPDTWIATKISRKPIAEGRNPETIRKNMKQK